MNPYVRTVQAMDDFLLMLEFENNERRVFDLKPYFELPVFAELKDRAVFASARVVAGSVEWTGEVDLSYDTLYLESRVVEEVGASA